MKRYVAVFFGIMMILSFFHNNIVYAYSLDDVKKEYPEFKIESTELKSGIVAHGIQLLTIKSKSQNVKLEFFVYEFGRDKIAMVDITYRGNPKFYLSNVLLRNETNARYVNSKHEIKRARKGAIALEFMSYFFQEDFIWYWSNAKIIQVNGTTNHIDVNSDTPEYRRCMQIMRKFLHEE